VVSECEKNVVMHSDLLVGAGTIGEKKKENRRATG